jgi:acetoin utilization deacetylase AcuC-like enzyme
VLGLSPGAAPKDRRFADSLAAMAAPQIPLDTTARGWRQRLRARLDRRRVTLFYDRGYSFAAPSTPADPLRAEKVLTALALRRLLDGRRMRAPPSASLRQLLQVHTAAYLEAVVTPEMMARAFGEPLSEVQRDRALAVQRAMTGGTLAAAQELVTRGGIAVNLGGGFHHAHRERAQGFCLFNDVAVAIAELRALRFTAPVLVVDLDLHDGDGTRALFADDPSVYTFSLHNRHWGEPTGAAATAIELGSQIGDAQLLALLAETLPDVFARHRPGLVIYLAGSDPAADDALGDWRLSAEGMLARDQLVTRLARGAARPVPLLVLLAGGYGHHAWRYTYRYLAWLLAGDVPAPPDEDAVLVARYRAVARLVSPAELTGAGGDESSWGLTEEELIGSLITTQADVRFLGYYTHHGLELALEQAGVFDRLRDLGYEQPFLELDLTPGRHTLRVLGDPRRRHLLVEVRLARDRRMIPGCELLAVDWMLLQHPQGSFSALRPALPGQRYPGLGMLKDAVALLVQVCHRLGLDGLSFTPSHYHIVQQSTKYLRMLDPEDAATVDALLEALAGVELARASRLVDQGKVVDANTGTVFRWRPMPMVLAISPALLQRFSAEGYEERRAAARAKLRFRLAASP